MSHERTNYGVIEDTGEDCTKTHCRAYYRAISKDLRCDGCDRELCGSCSIKLGGDVYCPACAVCGALEPSFGLLGYDKCGKLAVAWCQDCGLRLCDRHSAKHPDLDCCHECMRKRLEPIVAAQIRVCEEIMTCLSLEAEELNDMSESSDYEADEQMERYREIEAQS